MVSRELIERLYTAPPDGFVAARAAAVAEARAAGDTAAAREIGKLRKPTVAAWLVNLLAVRRPELVAELAELSAALRTAQRELRGPRLRELSAQRRAVVAALVGQARALAEETDPGLSTGKLPLAEVEATLQAALSDVEIAEQVRSGQLVRAASYAGFGEVPRPQLRLVTGGAEPTGRRERGQPAAAARAAREQAAARAVRRRALKRELTAARTEQRRAEAELARAVGAERAAVDALAKVQADLAELQRRRTAAEHEAERGKLARKTAERAAADARRRTGEVQAATEALADEASP